MFVISHECADHQIRLTLNSFAVKLQPTMGESSTSIDLKAVQAERLCYDLAIGSLTQLRVIYDIDQHILHHAQDSMSIMVACKSFRDPTH
jgi:hypothetical protein